MSPASVIMIICLPALLVFSGFFSGSETALFSLSRHQRAQIGREPGVSGPIITRLLSETRGLLITLLMGNMTINVLYFAIAAMLSIELEQDEEVAAIWPAVITVSSLIAIILFGEVLPKLVAARLPVRFSRAIALPLFITHRGLTPFRNFAQALVITPLARLFAPPQRPPDLSSEELESLLELSTHRGVIDASEERLLQQVLALSRLRVRDLMVPRVDIQAFDIEDDPAKLIELIRETRLRRLPVYRQDMDEIVGIISSRRALVHRPGSQEAVMELVEQAKFVPEQQRADQLLVDMRKGGSPLAIVVDEYGGTAGLVSIEDAVEQLVGELAGSYEGQNAPELVREGEGKYRVNADLSVHEWPQAFGRSTAMRGIPALDAVSTVGGLVMAMLGRVPSVGDQVQLGNIVITVDQMHGARIHEVLITLHHDQEDEA